MVVDVTIIYGLQNLHWIILLFFIPDPDFVNSFEYKDHVYFFFREAAVEYINCGKVTFCQ